MDRVRLAVVLEDVARPREFRQDDMDERDANGAFVGVVPTGDGVGQPVDRERWFTRREHVEGETRPGVREERVRLVERTFVSRTNRSTSTTGALFGAGIANCVVILIDKCLAVRVVSNPQGIGAARSPGSSAIDGYAGRQWRTAAGSSRRQDDSGRTAGSVRNLTARVPALEFPGVGLFARWERVAKPVDDRTGFGEFRLADRAEQGQCTASAGSPPGFLDVRRFEIPRRKSVLENSGQKGVQKKTAASFPLACHGRKFDVRSSPPGLMMRSTSRTG